MGTPSPGSGSVLLDPPGDDAKPAMAKIEEVLSEACVGYAIYRGIVGAEVADVRDIHPDASSDVAVLTPIS